MSTFVQTVATERLTWKRGRFLACSALVQTLQVAVWPKHRERSCWFSLRMLRMRATACRTCGCGPKMIVQQLSRTWERRMFLPQFLCKWAEPTNVATLHNSISSRGSGSEANDDNYSGHIDTVGPPDPVSNIRPLRLREPSSADVSMSVSYVYHAQKSISSCCFVGCRRRSCRS